MNEYTTAKMILHAYLLSIPMAKKIHEIVKIKAFEYPIYETHIHKFLLRKGIYKIINSHIHQEYKAIISNSGYWSDRSDRIVFDAKTGTFMIRPIGVATYTDHKTFK